MHYDVFNGDADGLCALLQLRLAEPQRSTLVTGVKRDIQLLKRLEANVTSEDQLTVLDISMARNVESLQRILESGAQVLYMDHHRADSIPDHPNLEAVINTDANVCTSLLVDKRLRGRFRGWAVTAAFGDNLQEPSKDAAESMGIGHAQLMLLKELGVYLNYNGYGSTVEDLHFAPDALFRELLPFDCPFAFIDDKPDVFHRLRDGYLQDMQLANALRPEHVTTDVAVYMLPDVQWARRVGGVFGNELANQYPNRAHAVITVNADQTYSVSVRAPLIHKSGADTLCQSFPTGGGRKAAAGINRLPVDQLCHFVDQFSAQYASH